MSRKLEIIRVSGIATGVGFIEKLPDGSGFYSESICETLYDTGHDKKDAQQSEQWAKKICDALNAEYSFTREELEARDRRVAAEAWDAAAEFQFQVDLNDYVKKKEPSAPNKETYINSLGEDKIN